MMTNAPFPSLCVAAKLEGLAVIRRFVKDAMAALGIDPATIASTVFLAVDEAAGNIITHGYQGQPGNIEIDVHHESNALVICLRDQAPPFDPTGVPAPDLAVSPEQRVAGGLGIHLIRQTAGKVIHHIMPHRGNELLLIKRLEEDSEDLDICDRKWDCST
jgi:serine/threonine-protein kinase RsbW